MVQKMSFENDKKAPIIGIRHLQCFLLFWGVSFAFAMRVNLSLAIVAMTDKKSSNHNYSEYSWSEKEKSFLLSSFFWGYVWTQIIGGIFAHKYGGKLAIFGGILISSILTLLTPLSADIGNWPLLFGLRVLLGMSQGMLFPTTHTILAKWAPPEERAVLGAFCYSGSQFGTVVMLAASGFIATSPLGWTGIFYISGGLGFVWCFAWYFWGASSPNEYNTISMAEKNYIQNSLSNGKDNYSTTGKHPKTPWLEFFTSPKFLSLLVTQCAFNWTFWFILTEIPSYMKNILGFDIKSNALLTALPYLAMLILSYVFTGFGALVAKYKCLSITHSRKFFNSISTWIPAVALLWLGYVDADHTELAVVLLVVAVGFSAAVHMGFQVNHIDLAPNFAGIMIGITSTFANIMSILAPLSVGFIVTDEKNPFLWRIVFFIAAGFCFIGNLLFVIFGSAKVQSWNDPTPVTDQELKPINKSNEV